MTLDKNLFNHEKFGSLEFQSNLKVRNYDTNKLENFLVNDFDWESKFYIKFRLQYKILGNLKNINYDKKLKNIKQNLLMNYSELWAYYPS